MNGNLWVILVLATIIIFLTIFGWMAITEVRGIYTLGVRVENSLIAAGWAGFKEIDLLKMATRLNDEDMEEREIFLNKAAAINTVRNYIKENLNLDEGYTPNNESYIHNENPVLIENIVIYNPDDLPAINNEGIQLERTTIHMTVLVPKNIKFYGTAYLKKNVYVDIDSFYKNKQ